MTSDSSNPTPIPAVAHAIAMSELDSTGTSGPSGEPVIRPEVEHAHPLRDVQVKLTVSVGTAHITVGDLLSAKAQQVLRLDRGVEQPVDVLLDGHVVARGTLVAVDECFGVRITELPIALDAPLGAKRP